MLQTARQGCATSGVSGENRLPFDFLISQSRVTWVHEVLSGQSFNLLRVVDCVCECRGAGFGRISVFLFFLKTYEGLVGAAGGGSRCGHGCGWSLSQSGA